MPKISVIIPVFNTERFLPNCLESVLSQSLTDFEIIAIDDASTDGSSRILAEYAARDPRIKVIRQDENKGGLQARNIGIRAASGKYTLFLDSDDCLLPGILQAAYQAAEKENADLVHFILEFHRRQDPPGKIVKSIYPMNRAVSGENVFQQYFVEDGFHWRMCEKLHRTELCKKTVEFISDLFCMMADDFCFSTVYTFFARSYIPLRQAGYLYYIQSGITGYREVDLEKFLKRQSPFQALRNVRDFLEKQNVWEKYREAFEKKEQELLYEYVLCWYKNLRAGDRLSGLKKLFSQYPAYPLFLAFRKLNKPLYRLFDGESAESLQRTARVQRIGSDFSYAGSFPLPAMTELSISSERWKEWESCIRKNGFDAVILSAEGDPERLLWDILAIQAAGALVIFRWTGSFLPSAGARLFQTVDFEQISRFADAAMLPDEDSVFWFRSSGSRAVRESAGPEEIRKQLAEPLQLSPEEISFRPRAEAFFRTLREIRKNLQDNYIEPAQDGETFVPFFRKLNTLFLRLPNGFRKRLFSGLGHIYDKIRGY